MNRINETFNKKYGFAYQEISRYAGQGSKVKTHMRAHVVCGSWTLTPHLTKFMTSKVYILFLNLYDNMNNLSHFFNEIGPTFDNIWPLSKRSLTFRYFDLYLGNGTLYKLFSCNWLFCSMWYKEDFDNLRKILTTQSNHFDYFKCHWGWVNFDPPETPPLQLI